ncbi:MFS transporter [Actinospica durhamensis]|uniref:MFS transporter n=1 Tax=Actinospica durhamensis TaxID=1508375 RepID=A0A941EYN6_9ACTN|nr:MFS transporter [Actinospica durhamensis]MBR7836434.1 MFS transporter [Actinospica durhamensis]
MDHSAQTDQAPSPPVERPLFPAAATVAACAAFVLLGALNAFFGPAIPALRSRFGLTPADAGLALSMYYVGAVAGVLLAGVIHPRTRNSRLLITSLVVMGVGSLGFALSANWSWALAACLLCGFGAGGMDYGLNSLFAIGFGRRSPAMLGILNAHYGLGAVCGPLLISLVGVENYPVAFGLVAGLLGVAAVFLRSVHTPPTSSAGHADAHGPARATSVLVLVVAFLAFYALQVTVETGVGAWEPTYLQTRLGHGAVYAADVTSGFWLMLAVGRLLVGPMTSRWSAPAIVTVSCLGTTACLALAAIPGLAPVAFAGVGLFNAPVFPVALPWLVRAAPGVRWAATGAILTANVGGAVAGPLTGLGIERFGIGCVPWLMTAVSAVCLALVLHLARATRATLAAVPEHEHDPAASPVQVSP